MSPDRRPAAQIVCKHPVCPQRSKVLEFKGRAPNPMTQEMADWRTIEEHLDKDTRKFEMYMTTSDGQEFMLFTHIYKRA